MTPFADLDLTPGRAIEWALRPSSKMDGTAKPFAATKRPSFSQELYYHMIQWLSGMHEGRLSVWIGTTVELPGNADLDALRGAFRQLLIRHETLRAEFRMEPDRDGNGALFGRLQCDVVAPEEVVLDQTELGTFDDVEVLRAALQTRIDGAIDTNNGPVLVMGAVIGEEKSVAWIVCDHLVTDGFSCAIKANELGSFYEANLENSSPVLPKVESYLDFGKTEYDYGWTVTPDDPRVELWRGFVERNGHVFTEFPVRLNSGRGKWHPSMVDNIQIFDASEADIFERSCRAKGASLVSGLLAINGIVLHELAGIDVFRSVMPVAQRRHPAWEHSVGWLVGLAPLEVPVAGMHEFPKVLKGAHDAFKLALSAADLPIPSIFMHLGTQYLPLKGLFDLEPQTHFSYCDYRKLPGARNYSRWKQTTALRAAQTPDARTWFFRNNDGVFMFTNFIDTPRARQVLADYQAGTRRVAKYALTTSWSVPPETGLVDVA